MNTLGARDFSSAVSCFCQVFSRGVAARGFGLRPKMCRPSANTENSHRTREKPLVPRVGYERWQHQTRKQRCSSPSEIAKSFWTFLPRSPRNFRCPS